MENSSDSNPKPGTTEKITVNLSVMDLAQIDLLVQQGFYANRTDLIRTAIRKELALHAEVVRQTASRETLHLGLRHLGRAELEAAQAAGERLELKVLGLLSISPDVSPELARATIASVEVLGALHASPEVKAALSERVR